MKSEENSTTILSVRLMTFNHEAYIEEALCGIDEQKTDFDFEVVIGDDFSTDNTLSIIANYPFRNPRLHLKILERKIGDQISYRKIKEWQIIQFFRYSQ